MLTFGKRGRGLQTKAATFVTLLIISIATLLIWFSIYQQRQQLYSSLKKRGLSLAKNLAYNSEYGILIANEDMLSKLIEGVKKEDDVAYCIIQDSEGKVLSSTKTGLEKAALLGEINEKSIRTTEPLIQLYRTRDEEWIYDITVPVQTGAEESQEMKLGLFPGEREKEEIRRRKIGVVRVGMSLKNTRILTQHVARINILLTLELVLIGVVATIIGMRNLVRPIRELLKATQKVAQGDLTQKVKIKSKDEIEELADGFNALIQSMRQMVGQIRTTADKVSLSAQGISSAAQQMNTSIVEISSAIQQISKGVTTQAIRMDETSKFMEEISGLAKQVATNAQQVAVASEQTMSCAQTGGEATEEAIEKMNKIVEVVTASANLIQALSKHSQQIGEITELITNVADQTNLLALNAAIEAARAGEAGGGFAVVAEEIRKLAENSVNAATKIGGLIREIQTGISKAVSSVQSGAVEVGEGKLVVNKVGGALNEIIQAVRKTATMVRDISVLTQQQLKGTEQVVKAIEEVANIASQSSVATQEVSSSVQRQTASMQEMASSAQELSRMATELRDLVRRFKLEEGEN